jgi:hypothetical protein
MIDAVVEVEGNVAVPTFNLVNYGQPSGSTQETVLARWNATEVYRTRDGTWQILHAHWSFTQPQLAEQKRGRYKPIGLQTTRDFDQQLRYYLDREIERRPSHSRGVTVHGQRYYSRRRATMGSARNARRVGK